MINIRQKQNNDTEIILDDIQIAQLEALSNYLPIEQVAGYFKISVDDLLSLQIRALLPFDYITIITTLKSNFYIKHLSPT
jgi:hypothetical protein